MYCQILESIRFTKNSQWHNKKIWKIYKKCSSGERDGPLVSHYQFWSLQVKNLVKPNKTQEIEHIYVLDK